MNRNKTAEEVKKTTVFHQTRQKRIQNEIAFAGSISSYILDKI